MMVKVWRAIEQLRTGIRGSSVLPGQQNELERALSLVPLELTYPAATTAFRIIVEGASRPLHPAVGREVYEIGRQGLLNAFRHSHATKIEAILHFATNLFGMVIRDNGCGIALSALPPSNGRDFGLSRIQERTERIGARLKLLSRVASGTELQLILPAEIAFNRLEDHFPEVWSLHSGFPHTLGRDAAGL